MTASDLYLDLMKKTLSFSLWPEPPHDFAPASKSFIKKAAGSLLVRYLAKRQVRLMKDPVVPPDGREAGNYWPKYADTMIGMKRLDNLQFCVEKVIQDNIPGDLIETGVWRGGSCIFMRAILAAHGITDRTVFVADSFEGLPKPNEEKYPADKGDLHYSFSDFLGVSEDGVKANFMRYGLLDEQVRFLKGWFKDTLPIAPIERLAVLCLDGDMYESTIDAIGSLYPKLSDGGFCIVDDFSINGCRQAIADYRAQHGIAEEIHTIDWTGVFWRKAQRVENATGVQPAPAA